MKLTKKEIHSLSKMFTIMWMGAVLAERPRQRDLLSMISSSDLVEKGKNGHPKLELTKEGKRVIEFAKTTMRKKIGSL